LRRRPVLVLVLVLVAVLGENLRYPVAVRLLEGMHRHELTEAQWQKVAPLVYRYGRKCKRGDRSFLNAVIYALKTGTPWRDLPDRFGPWKTVYNRFANWSKARHFERILRALQLRLDRRGSLVDATIARAHQDASGGKGGPLPTLWAVHVVDSRRRFTPSSMPRDARSTSS
jgi:transposase